MPFTKLPDDTRLHYREHGNGPPLLLLHGMWMSSAFFARQFDALGKVAHVIAPDFRGHGLSDKPQHGHTVSQYAADVHALVNALQLEDVAVLGWSMGALVMWSYLQQFGQGDVRATIVVDQGPSDFRWPDWPQGVFGLAQLHDALIKSQTAPAEYARRLVIGMFRKRLAANDAAWMQHEVLQVPPAIASTILVDQTLQDFRNDVAQITTPTLLAFAGDNRANGSFLAETMPNAELVYFSQSWHCPFWDEAPGFNRTVADFLLRHPSSN